MLTYMERPDRKGGEFDRSVKQFMCIGMGLLFVIIGLFIIIFMGCGEKIDVACILWGLFVMFISVIFFWIALWYLQRERQHRKIF